MKHLLIFYPTSGIKNKNELNNIETYLRSNNFDYILHKTLLENGPMEIIASVKGSFDRVIVAGGDGPISQTILAMHTNAVKCPLLVVPVGTSNEISQNLYLKKGNINDVLLRLNNNEIKKFDYGLVNKSLTFVYALIFGNFTQVSYKTLQKLKNLLGFRAYIMYGLLTFRKNKSYRLSFCNDEIRVSGSYIFGSISNSERVGTIFKYNKDTFSLQDGKFEVLLISKPRNIKEIRLIVTGIINHDYSSEMFTTFKTSKLEIKSKVFIDWNIDGEFAGSLNEIEVINLNKKMRLIV